MAASEFEKATAELAAAEAARAKAVKKLSELKNSVYKDAIADLKEKKIDFAQLMEYYKNNEAAVIYRIEYHDPQDQIVVFERRQGQLGPIKAQVKEQLRKLGRDKLVKGVLVQDAGTKVVESILKN